MGGLTGDSSMHGRSTLNRGTSQWATVSGRETSDPASSSSTASLVGVVSLLLLLWTWSWLPQLIDLIVIGRQYPELGATPRRSPMAAQAYSAIILGMLLVSAALILSPLVARRKILAGSIAILLLPWCALNVSYLVAGGRNNEIMLLPVVLLAFALHYCHLESLYSWLRRLTVITATASLILGVWLPDLFLSDPDRALNNEKAIFGDLLLNGLFPTSNQLGVSLVLGIPLLAITGKGKWRWLGVAITMVAVAWASSRTSLAAAAIIMASLPLVLRASQVSARRGLSAAIFALTMVTVAAPFLFEDPAQFSGRVAIWNISLDYVLNGPTVQGGGAMTFRELSPVTVLIGAVAGTGHNVFVTVFVVGGIVALIATTILFWTYLVSCRRQFHSDRLPLVFLLGLCALAVLEDPLRGFIVAPSSFIILPVLGMTYMAGRFMRADSLQTLRRKV